MFVADHLSIEEIKNRYSTAAGDVEVLHWQIILLAKSRNSARQISHITGYDRSWVATVVSRYNHQGPDAVVDRRRFNQGRPPTMTAEQVTQLAEALRGPAPDGGLWNSTKVAQWMGELLGHPIDARQAWRYMRKAGFTLQQPRTHHAKGDPEEQEKFKKKDLPEAITELRRKYPETELEVWGEDEHRLGLQPIIRRIWAPCGQRPELFLHPRYEWLYVYAFICPETGESEWYIIPTVNIGYFSEVLADFARIRGAGEERHLIIVLDRAAWHMAKDVEVPVGIHLLPQPAYSPELQPAERLWPLVNEAVANRYLADLSEIDQLIGERCCTLKEKKELLRAYTLYHWWPRVSVQEEIVDSLL